jgi:hypothetical protein
MCLSFFCVCLLSSCVCFYLSVCCMHMLVLFCLSVVSISVFLLSPCVSLILSVVYMCLSYSICRLCMFFCIYLSFCLRLNVCQYVFYLSNCCLHIFVSFCLHPSISLSVFVRIFVSPSVCPSLFLSVCPSVSACLISFCPMNIAEARIQALPVCPQAVGEQPGALEDHRVVPEPERRGRVIAGQVPAQEWARESGHHRGAVQLRGYHPVRGRHRACWRRLPTLARQAAIRFR